MSDSLLTHGLYSPWNSPEQNTGVGSLSLLQGIFPTQGSNSGLPHYRWILHQLSHRGSPRILEWVAYPFSNRSSQPRNWTRSPALHTDSLPTELWGKHIIYTHIYIKIWQTPHRHVKCIHQYEWGLNSEKDSTPTGPTLMAEWWRIDAFELWCWKRLLRVPWTARRSN